MPKVRVVQKLIILSEDGSYQTLMFLVEYGQNAMSLLGYIWLVYGWDYILAQVQQSQLFPFFLLYWCPNK